MVVLDTHALVWWVSNPEKLSARARKAIQKEVKSGELLVSAITVWELYMLVKSGKLVLAVDVGTWLEKVEQFPYIQFVPVDNTIASSSVTLPEPLHKDPADRMIIATALQHGAPLITGDKRIRTYPLVQTIW